MKKVNPKAFLTLALTVWVLIVLFSLKQEIQFSPPADYFAKTCSDTDIKLVWDNIFTTSSTGITIVKNTTSSTLCENYYAWKISGNSVYVMAGVTTSQRNTGPTTLQTNSSGSYFLWGNFTSDVNSSYLALTPAEVGNRKSFELIAELYTKSKTLGNPWPSQINPDTVFSSTFDYPRTETFISGADDYSFTSNSGGSGSSSDTNISYSSSLQITGLVHAKNKTALLAFVQLTNLTCTPDWVCSELSNCTNNEKNRTCVDQKNCGITNGKPQEIFDCSVACLSNWTAVNSSACTSNETFPIWFKDTNNCANTTAPANQTGYCDYDHNNLIGRVTDIADKNIDLSVTIEGADINYSSNYTGIQEVKLISSSTTRVKFDYNFDSAPLNFKKIKVEIQNSSNPFGYIIIDGLDVTNKEVTLSKIRGSNEVCVRDNSVTNINNIDEDCDGSNDYYLECPGTNDEFECFLTPGNYYIVSGLDHSAVKELKATNFQAPPSNCTQLWNCGSWSNCFNNTQTRTCFDSHNCNSSALTKNETQSCSNNCVSNWTCTEWSPTECSSNRTQTRTCTDANNCQASTTQSRECTPNNSTINWPLFLAIGLGALVIVVAIVLIIAAKKRRDSKRNSIDEESVEVTQKPATGEYSPFHYGPKR